MGDLFGVSRSVERDFMSALSNFPRFFLTVYLNDLLLALPYCDYEGRSINKLQKYAILLVFQI